MTAFTQALVARGLPEHVAKAFTANAEDESGLRSDINEIKPLVPGSRGGFGLMQWTGPRRKQLEAFAQEKGVPVSDINLQADFLVHELNTTERKAAERILGQRNAADAAVSIMNDFLRPHKSHRPKREARYREMFGSDTLQGGEGSDQLAPKADLLQEAIRRGLISKEDLQAEAERRGLVQSATETANQEAREQTRTDVEHALGQLEVEGELDPIDILTGGMSRLWPDAIRQRGNTFAQGFLMEFADELVGLGNALPRMAGNMAREAVGLEPLEGGGIQESQDRIRERQRAFDEQNPVEAIGLRAAGGATSLAPIGGGLVGSAATTGGKVAAGVGEGAAIGAVVGAGAADNGDRAQGAALGAAGGAIAGGVLARAGVSLDRFLKARTAQANAPTKEAMRFAANRMFEEAKKSGIVYKPQAARQLADDLTTTMGEELITEGLHTKSYPLFNRVLKELEGGQPLSLERVSRLRELAAKARQGTKDPADGRLMSMLVEKLDDFSLDEAGMAVAGKGAQQAKEGRALWAQFRKAETIERLLEDATLETAASGSGGNINNAIRRKMGQLLKNPKRIAGFTAEERQAIRAVADQGLTQDSLRLIGKLSPGGNGLMTALQTGALVETGGLSAPLMLVAAGAKSTADRITTKRADAVIRTILGGGRVQQSKLAQLTLAERRAVSRAIVANIAEPLGEEVTSPLLPAPLETAVGR